MDYKYKMTSDEIFAEIEKGNIFGMGPVSLGTKPSSESSKLDDFKYDTKDFAVEVKFYSETECVFSYYYDEEFVVLKWSPKTSAARAAMKRAKAILYHRHMNALYEEAKSLGYDPRTAEIAVHTHYSLESRVARTVNQILDGNTNFRPFVSKNRWHDISNRSFELWYKTVTGKEAPELSGPRWYAVLALVEDVLGPIEVDRGTAARWATN